MSGRFSFVNARNRRLRTHHGTRSRGCVTDDHDTRPSRGCHAAVHLQSARSPRPASVRLDLRRVAKRLAGGRRIDLARVAQSRVRRTRETPHRLEHAPAPAPVRVAYARRAEEMGGWRALAAARARVERLTSKLILDPDVGDVWHLDEKARLHPDTYVWTTDVWTKARRLFADAESRAWAICAARGRLAWGVRTPRGRSRRRRRTWGTWISRARIHLRRTSPRASAEGFGDDGTRPSSRSSPPRRGRESPTRSSPPRRTCAYGVHARLRIRATSWRASSARPRTSRRFCGTGGSSGLPRRRRAYVGGRDARSAHRVDPDAVAAALDKLGAEFKRRLVSANVDPASDPLRAVEMLMEYFSARMRGEEDFSRARDDAGPVGLDAEARFFFERSPLHAGPIPEDAFAALDPRVPAPVTGGLRLRKPAMGPGAGYYQMRNSSLASVLNQHEGDTDHALRRVLRHRSARRVVADVPQRRRPLSLRGHAPRRRRRIANGTSRGSVSRHAAVSAKPLRAPPPRDARRRNRRRGRRRRETPAQLDEHLRRAIATPGETRRVVSRATTFTPSPEIPAWCTRPL